MEGALRQAFQAVDDAVVKVRTCVLVCVDGFDRLVDWRTGWLTGSLSVPPALPTQCSRPPSSINPTHHHHNPTGAALGLHGLHRRGGRPPHGRDARGQGQQRGEGEDEHLVGECGGLEGGAEPPGGGGGFDGGTSVAIVCVVFWTFTSHPP